MKIYALLLFFSAFLMQSQCSEASCEIEPGPGYKNGFEIIDDRAKDLIKNDAPLMPGGKIKCSYLYMHSEKINRTVRREEGVYDGIKYQIWFDGSGMIQGAPGNSVPSTPIGYEFDNWRIKCERDKIDDKVFCYLQKENFSIGIWKNGSFVITIASEARPNSEIAIRIDENKPFFGSAQNGFDKKSLVKIIEQLKQGNSVTTRYEKWPGNQVDSTLDLFGFNQALKIMQMLYNSLSS